MNREAAKYYYYLLRTPEGAPGLEYLKKRGLTAETMQRFGLGYAGRYSDGLYRYLKKKGVSDELLKKSGLMQVNEKQGMYDKFWNRVMFPIMDLNGKVVGFGGRVMGDAKPKYLNSPETAVFDKSRNLYGLNFARSSRKKQLLLCEGYMDVISLHQAGFTNAVASLGTALTSQHASLLKRFTDEAVLTYDSDEAGIRAALRAIPLLKEAGVTAKVLHMEPYKDPDEFIKAQGAEAFQERIDQAENSFLFEISVLEKSFDMSDPEEKTKFFQAVARKISGFELEVERENYIEAITGKYQISFQGLRKMVMNWLMQGAPPVREAPKSGKRKEKEDGILRSQRLILTWLAEHPGLYPSVRQYIHPEDFSQELYQKAAKLLFDQLEKGEVNPAQILSAFEDPEEQGQAAALFHADLAVETPKEWDKALRETLAKIMDYSIKKKTAQMDPADLQGLQQLVDAKRRLQQLGRLHISL